MPASSRSLTTKVWVSLWTVEFPKLAWLEATGCGHNRARVRLKLRPTRGPQHEDREPAASQILLIPKILVGGDEHVEAHRFSGLDEHTVLKLGPAALERSFYSVGSERAPQWRGSALVEKNSQTPSRRDCKASARVFEHRIDLVPPYARKPLEEIRDRCTSFQVLEEGAHGHTRAPE